jgi:hypothetical protein
MLKFNAFLFTALVFVELVANGWTDRLIAYAGTAVAFIAWVEAEEAKRK